MLAFDFPLDDYLEKIGITTAPNVSDTSLQRIHRAQVMTIPFENLDIGLGRSIRLEPEVIADKLIRRDRGGYCFELNGLLHQALHALGFEVSAALARVSYNQPYNNPEPGPRTHQILRIRLDNREWLADVGFGGPGLRAPMPLEAKRVDHQYGEDFRLRTDPHYGWMLQKYLDDQWVDLYAFADEVTTPLDLQMANHFTSTWPGSPFVGREVCALPTETGRITLVDREFSHYHHDQAQHYRLEGDAQWQQHLWDYFRIRL